MANPAAMLRSAIQSIAVPGTPPPLSRRGAPMGLALLEVALGMHHVRRLTERVVILEHSNARRFTEVDVNLSVIDEQKREILSTDASAQASGGPSELWIPVARIVRENANPIDVRNAAGSRVPRMTQYESSYIIATGAFRLLRAILASHQDARESGSLLHTFLYREPEPRFLVEAAIVALVTERSKPTEPIPAPEVAPSTVTGFGARHRQHALDVLNTYANLLPGFFALLEVAVHNYLLVVALDAARPEHSLSYESPLYVRPDPTRARIVRRLNAARRGMAVNYATTLPPGLRSYHLVAETSVGLEIRHLYLSTDADSELTRNLVIDLQELGKRLGSTTSRAKEKALELELQTVLRKMADIARRRRWEFAQADRASTLELAAVDELSQAVLSGDAVVDPNSGALDNSILRNPAVSRRALANAALAIDSAGLSRDLSFETDPANNRAHAYWRRRATTPTTTEEINIVAGMLIVDETASASRNVRLYAFSNSLLAYAVGCFVGGTVFPFGRAASTALANSDRATAVVLVLLLIPGLLYSRLSLPDRRAVTGYIQTLPRVIGRTSLFVISALATSFLGSNGSIIEMLLVLAVVVPLALIAFLYIRPPNRDPKRIDLLQLGAPEWLARTRDARASSRRHIDIVVRSSGLAE